MATVVNNDGTQGANGMGNLLAVVLLIAFVIALLYFGLPLLNGAGTGGSNVTLPSEVNVNTK